MSSNSLRSQEIRIAKKESLLFQEFSKLFLRITQETSELAPLVISRVKLSRDKGVCTIYFYTVGGEEAFNSLLQTLVLYKPSLRKGLSQAIPSRYVPNLVFKYDTLFEKQKVLEDALNEISAELSKKEEQES